ncbi:MAG: hypothetical protein LBJ60_07515 [Tannerellaceae bacterium]|jgi:hypothetical protein|nr:hypothetical protein [Tannerellaceae bacterium]
MKRLTIYIIGMILLFAGCNDKEKEARVRYGKAKNFYEQNDLFAAKNEIDSIRIYYPKEVKVMKDAIELKRLVELKEADRNIAYCDSLLPIRQKEVGELNKNFILEKDTLYQDMGNYVWKQQTIERNVERSYVRCKVSEDGATSLESVYFGSRSLNHTGIKVSAKDGIFAETASIPYDGGLNYRFQDLGNTTEVVTYKRENGVDVVKFIYANAGERIKVEYTGGKAYTIYMADADKKALVATYDLAAVLSDVDTLIRERDKAIKRKAYLEGKLNQE